MLTLIFSLVGLFFILAFLCFAWGFYRIAMLFPATAKLLSYFFFSLSMLFLAAHGLPSRGGLAGILDNFFLFGGSIVLGILGFALFRGSQSVVASQQPE